MADTEHSRRPRGWLIGIREAIPLLGGYIPVAISFGLISTQAGFSTAETMAISTLIYAGEPVWAGVFGRIAGERLPPAALLGGLLVVAAVIVSELDFGRRRKTPPPAG